MSSPSSELSHHAKIYRAGAGAGKTTQLVHEVYTFYNEFKKEYKKEPKIVLTTFTRKATQELKERLMIKAQQNNDYDFLNFVLSRSCLLISTIHGILQVFLKQYAQVIDLDPGFEIVDKNVLLKDAKTILKDILHETPEYSELLEEFTFKQLTQTLAKHSENILKHEQVTHFTAADIQDLQRTLCQDLAGRLDRAVLKASELTSDEKWTSFFGILKMAEAALKGESVTPESLAQIYEGVRKPTYSPKKPVFDEVTHELIAEVWDEFKKIGDKLQNPEKTRQYMQIYQTFENLAFSFHEHFLKYKKEKGRIGLGDLETFALQILNQDASRYSSFSKSYDYWLIDEFQDTAPIQVEILKKIIGSQKKFIVGDPQQSIYFFRGARVRVFDEMQTSIVEGGGTLQTLNTNYRSRPELMSFINYFFTNYKNPFQEMQIGAKPAEESSFMQVGLFESEEQQAQGIAQHILNLSGSTPLGEICVIARKNDHLKFIAQELKKNKVPYYLHSAQGFNERREILDIKAFLKFLVNPHDNFNLILLLRSPWFLVEEKSIIAITQKTRSTSFWKEFLNVQGQQGYESVLELKKYWDRAQSDGLSHTLQVMISEKNILKTAYQIDNTGRRESNIWKLISILRKEDHNPNFNFLNFLEEGADDTSTEEGADNSDAVSSLEPNQVQLMTVHMSKGLEFKHVVIPYINKDPNTTKHMFYYFDEDTGKWGLSLRLEEDSAKMPLPLAMEVEKIREEEKEEYHRLFYVALTRAQEGVLLTSMGKSQNASWLAATGIPLDMGEHDQKTFKYQVVSEIQDKKTQKLKQMAQGQALKPVFNLEKSVKEADTVSVTEQLKWLNQGVDKVVPLMKAAQEGQRLHRIFESLKYKDFDTILKSLSAEDQKAIHWVWGLKDIPFQAILSQGYAEWGFIVKTPEGSLSGQIDIWAELDSEFDDEIWILDYKTGRSMFHEKALMQLKSYGQALKNRYPKKNIRLAAIYPFEQKSFIESLS